jgi:hypothetical protein
MTDSQDVERKENKTGIIACGMENTLEERVAIRSHICDRIILAIVLLSRCLPTFEGVKRTAVRGYDTYLLRLHGVGQREFAVRMPRQ